MTINFIRYIIENLKRQEPILKNTRFQNRWEEIKDTTLANLSLNLLKQEQVLESTKTVIKNIFKHIKIYGKVVEDVQINKDRIKTNK